LNARPGGKVYLDFLSNPEPVNRGGGAFSLETWTPMSARILKTMTRCRSLPIDRLRRMNPLAIELYRMHGTDLASEPLEFAMNNQHMNGGILIDDWGRTSS
jgi:succinate dehydrogenase / fumarate reductase flavoprotein subunit